MLILLYLPYPVDSQSSITMVSGKNADYAGDSLKLYRYSDLLTRTEELVAACKPDLEGNFSFKINITGTYWVHLELGIYRGSLLIEEGKSYQIVLPPLTKKSQAQQLNPFFKPIDLSLGIINENPQSTSRQLDQIDTAIDSFIQVHQFDLQSKRGLRQSFGSFKKNILSEGKSGYALDYQEYRLAQLEQYFYHYNQSDLLEKFFLNKAILPHNQAYMDFLHLEFKNVLKLIVPAQSSPIQEKNLSLLRQRVDSALKATNPDFRDLWIVKGLYEGFYGGAYASSEVLPLLELMEKDLTCHTEIRTMASNAIHQITWLLPGYPAPGFNLRDQGGFDFYLETFRGKYLYLSFVSKESYSFRQDIEILKLIHKKFPRNLEVVSISVDENFNDFLEYMAKQSCQWTFLQLENQTQLMKKYKVRTLPTYYLIDPYGKILLAPAPSPQENFENEFYRILNKRN
jgi:hypothetical protein